MIKREFRIENFRTLGISKPFELELGAISESNKSFGGVLLLVGQNNAGKSNIIAALKAYSDKTIGLDNKPRHLIDNTIEPRVKYVVKDENLSFFVKANKGKYEIDISSETDKVIFAKQKDNEVIYSLSSDNSSKALIKMLNFASNNKGETGEQILSNWGVVRGYSNKPLGQFGIPVSQHELFENMITEFAFIEKPNGFPNLKYNEFTNEILKTVVNHFKNIPVQSILKFAQYVFEVEPGMMQSLYNDLIKPNASSVSREEKINEYFKENYKIDLIPTIT
ncbi:MAG: hypothetical protein RBQ97_08040, partial [Acholeplasma sp.]|nr:hypothetical protein [Acholeplasma sp.]